MSENNNYTKDGTYFGIDRNAYPQLKSVTTEAANICLDHEFVDEFEAKTEEAYAEGKIDALQYKARKVIARSLRSALIPHSDAIN